MMLIPVQLVQANDALIYGLGLAASITCALTGVLVARDKGVDLFGALMAGIATSLGAVQCAICCSAARFSGWPMKPISGLRSSRLF